MRDFPAARRIVGEWRGDYDHPHTSLGGLTPDEFAIQSGQTTARTESSYEQGRFGGNVTSTGLPICCPGTSR